MKYLLASVAGLFLCGAVMADHHASIEAEVRDTVTAFNAAYAENRVDDYFGYYADDASVYFYGARQDLDAYYAEWKEMAAAGGGVERNDMSDLRIQVMPGGDVAVASYFVDYRYRAPDGDISAAKAFESEVWRKVDGAWKIVNLHYSEYAAE
ncbi:MAG: nuclear transport factor 2 family protein [Woeseiaceae bacterium]|jgi:ketosteroid isomerase-like protein|nr:nuclear transport factor 2 family protein [Woeseiaceae bacterium]